MATPRQRHHAPPTDVPATPATGPERMAANVRTPGGKALEARRTVMVAPVVGPSKAARGFRRCFLRGLAHMRGAWRLVCLTQNLLKIWRDGRRRRGVSTMWSPLSMLAMALRRAS